MFERLRPISSLGLIRVSTPGFISLAIVLSTKVLSGELKNMLVHGKLIEFIATSCKAYRCKTSDVGTGCASCVEQSLRISDAHCASCNADHMVVGASCQETSPSAHTSTSTEYNRYPHREANTTIGSAMVSSVDAAGPCMPLLLTATLASIARMCM